MKAHSLFSTFYQEQDLALRLQQAALRRASDEALRQAPGRTRWIAPDVMPLLDNIFTRTASCLSPEASATLPGEKTEEGQAKNDNKEAR
jgi:hypothetical protein